MQFVKFFGITILSLLTLCACKSAKEVMRVGVIAGPEAELVETAKQVAKKKYDLNIEVIEFTDYTMPNEALHSGSIDANIFQHKPYLKEANKSRGYDLVAIAKTFIFPMGIYSVKVSSIGEVPDHAMVAIPNDPSNEARALLLLHKAGLIQLNPSLSVRATADDVIANPKDLKIKMLDAAELPRVLKDVTLATINTNYAIPAGLLPSRDALYLETKNSPYANLLVVREGEKNDPKFLLLIKALHSPEVLAKAKVLFKGQAIPAWDPKMDN